MSDDTPTQRFDSPLTPSTLPESPDPEKKSRALLIALIAVGALLVIAVIILVIVLIGGTGTPTAATTPTATPSSSTTPTATTTPSVTASSAPSSAASKPAAAPPKPSSAPTANGAPVFTSFNIPDATCTGTTGTSPVTIQYSSVGATSAYFGISVANAKEAPTDGPLPPKGPYTYNYQCSNATQIWVITLVDGAGGTTNMSREVHSGAK